MTRQATRVTFYSDELRISGILFMPDGADACPAVVLPQGTVGLKEHYRSPAICSLLADAGFAALTLDYQGFGDSEGSPGQPRNQIVPLDQIQNVRDAVTFLSAQPRVDATRVALFGFCWGGTHSVYAGSIDPRVKCVIEVGGMGDGTRWLRSIRQPDEWNSFLQRIEADRVNRVLKGKSEVVSFGDILIGTPTAREGRRRIIAEIAPPSPPYRSPSATMQTAERILEYRPEEVVGRLSPRPLLIMHCGADDLVPPEEAHSLHKAAGEPKELVMFGGASHHDVYLDPLFHEVMTISLGWLKRWLRDSECA